MQNSTSSSYTPSAMIYKNFYHRLLCGPHDESLGPGISDYLYSGKPEFEWWEMGGTENVR